MNRILNTLRLEPFRILFPFGYFCMVFGLGIWSVNLLGNSTESARLHAILLGDGFLFAFSLGLLLTEIPRLLLTPSMGLAQLFILLATLAGMALAVLGGNVFYAQALYGLALFNLGVFLVRSLMASKTKGHPGPALALTAVILSLIGTVHFLLAESFVIFREFGSWGSYIGLQAYFLLFSVACLRWKREYRLGGQGGDGAWFWMSLALLITSLGLEAFAGFAFRSEAILRVAYVLRSLWIAGAITRPGRIYPLLEGAPWHGVLVRAGLSFMLAGAVLVVFNPAHAIVLNHVTFLAGYAWIALSAATGLIAERVKTGTRRTGIAVLIVGGLSLGVGTLLRIAAGFGDHGHGLMLAIGAVFALIPLFLWAIVFFPMLADTDNARDSDPAPSAPSALSR